MDRKRGGGRKVVLVRELADDRKPLYLSPLSIRLISSFVRDCLWERLWSCVVLFNWSEFCSFLFLFFFFGMFSNSYAKGSNVSWKSYG